MKSILTSILLIVAFITSATAQKLTLETTSQLYGYKKADGSWKIAPQYQKATAFTEGERPFAVVKIDGRWGCIDVDGNMVVRPLFVSDNEARTAGQEWQKGDEPGKWIYPAQNKSTMQWGYVDYYGQWRFEPRYERAGTYEGTDPMSFAPVRLEGRWGCIDGKGILVINTIFMTEEQARLAGRQWIIGRHYDTWRYPVTDPKTGLYGYVNYLGRWVIDARYKSVLYYGEDNNYPYAQVQDTNGRWGNIDAWGKTISENIFFTSDDALYALREREHGRSLKGWRLPVTNPETKLWGWVNHEGNWVIAPQYDDATRFANDTGRFATAKKDGRWASIDDEGFLLSKIVFVLSSDAWQAGNEWDTEQEQGHWLFPIQDTTSGMWGYVDYTGKWVLDPRYEDAKLFNYTWNNRMAPAKQSGYWGCIDHTGRFVVTNQYNTSSEAYVAGRRWGEKQKF